jgi:hypothetical protein
MLMSLHISRYRLPAMIRAATALARRRDELAQTPGLAVARLLGTAELSTIPAPLRGLSRRHLALMCGWDDDTGLDRALADSEILRAFERDSIERWHVSLQPVNVLEGDWNGWEPVTDGVEPLAADEPMLVLTWATLCGRQALPFSTFWRANARAVEHLESQSGLLMSTGLGNSPRRASTLSLWRSHEDAKRYAYQAGDHQPVIRPSIDKPWTKDRFFARFRPLASSGSWNGRDPVAEALAARSSADVAAAAS